MTKLTLASGMTLVGLCAACSAAPKDDAPDYEVDYSSGAGSRGGANTGGNEGATLEGEGSNEPAPEQTTKSAEIGTETDAGTGAAPAPEPTKVSVKIDGRELTIVSAGVYPNNVKSGSYDVVVKVKGTGVADGSDIHAWASATKTGCENTSNYLVYRPKGDAQYMPKSATDPSCGLVVTELPTAVGGRFKATFDATLYSINVTPQKTKRVVLSLDLLREK